MKVRLPNALRDHVYPDASVSCDPRDLADDEAESISYPRLVVEALSDSTDNYDRGAKFGLYQGCGTFVEYVLVDTRRVGVEVRARRGWRLANALLRLRPGRDVTEYSDC